MPIAYVLFAEMKKRFPKSMPNAMRFVTNRSKVRNSSSFNALVRKDPKVNVATTSDELRDTGIIKMSISIPD